MKLSDLLSDRILLESQQDDYMTLAEKFVKGDESVKPQLEKMVAQAAHQAGYTTGPVHHGTKAQFREFDPGTIKTYGEGVGFYFTDDPATASHYGDTKSFYLKMQKPIGYSDKAFSKPTLRKILERLANLQAEEDGMEVADGFLSNWGDIRDEGMAAVIRSAVDGLSMDDTITDQLSGLYNAGVSHKLIASAVHQVVKNDGYIAKGYSGEGIAGGTIYVVWFPNQIKSAAPVTFYPDNKIIPLENRFSSSNDLNESVGDTDQVDTIVYHSGEIKGALEPWTHFGTKAAAVDRKRIRGGKIKPYHLTGRFIEVNDLGTWAIWPICSDLIDAGVITKAQATKVMDTDQSGKPGEQWKMLENLIKKAGFDGLSYINEVENRGSMSYMVVNTKAIKEQMNESSLNESTIIEEDIKITEKDAQKYASYIKLWDKARYDDWFHGEERIFIPFSKDEGEKVEAFPELVQALDLIGYKVTDYVAGLCRKEGGKQDEKIGKVLRKHQEEIDENLDPDAADVGQIPMDTDDLIRRFESDPQRGAKKGGLMLVISRHPLDLAKMAEDRPWSASSCMRMSHDNHHYVWCDISEGTLIAYLTHESDKDLENPVGRVLIKPYINQDDPKDVMLVNTRLAYGANPAGFFKAVDKWLASVQDNKAGKYELNPELYHDHPGGGHGRGPGVADVVHGRGKDNAWMAHAEPAEVLEYVKEELKFKDVPQEALNAIGQDAYTSWEYYTTQYKDNEEDVAPVILGGIMRDGGIFEDFLQDQDSRYRLPEEAMAEVEEVPALATTYLKHYITIHHKWPTNYKKLLDTISDRGSEMDVTTLLHRVLHKDYGLGFLLADIPEAILKKLTMYYLRVFAEMALNLKIPIPTYLMKGLTQKDTAKG